MNAGFRFLATSCRMKPWPCDFRCRLEPNRPLGPKGSRCDRICRARQLCYRCHVRIARAWPVTPFFGADVALLAFAMNASVKAARRRERLILTSERCLSSASAPMASTRCEELNPYWLRVDHEDPELLARSSLSCRAAALDRRQLPGRRRTRQPCEALRRACAKPAPHFRPHSAIRRSAYRGTVSV